MSPAALLKIYSRLSVEAREKLDAFAQKVAAEEPILDANKHFTFSWAGAMSHLKDKYTSVELQKKSMEWMTKS